MEKRQIKFGELKIGEKARQNLMDCCDRNWITMGPKTEEFEKRWGELFGYPYNISTSSGTDALIASYASLYEYGAIPNKSAIIAPALSFISTANAIRASGLKIQFCDIKKETLNIDEDKIEECITTDTVAIVVVHTMGRPAQMDKILNIATKHNLKIIEDCCESHSAKFKGEYVGTFGDMACFSFFTAHCCVCGEQGMISCKDKDLSYYLQSIRNHGRSGQYFDFPRYGINNKNTDLTSSIGLEGLAEFKTNFAIRYNHMKTIRYALDKYTDIAWFSEEDEANINCPHGFSITLKKSDKIKYLKQVLDDATIEWKRNFGNIPSHGAFKYLNIKPGTFKNSEFVGDNGLHIGLHPYLSNEDIKYIIYHISCGLDLCK